MQSLVSKCKQTLLEVIAFIVFYTGMIKSVNRVVNSFQPRGRNGKGRLVFPFVKRRRFNNIQILGYHRVNDDPDPFFPPTPVHVFTNQMDYLASNYTILSLEEAVERIRRDEIPDKAVVVTFDDGYRDNYLNAFPVLQRLSIPATIFLATAVIGSGKALWHDKVFSAFRETRVSFLEGFGSNSKTYYLRTVEEKLFAQKDVLRFLRSLDSEQKSRWIAHLREKLEVADEQESSEIMLTWEEVKIMHQNGIFFGSHTITHPTLINLSPSQAVVEIHESKKIIEEKLGTPVKTFAYPNGKKEDFNEVTKNILREAGYLCALTTIFGANDNRQDLFELRRGNPWEEYLPTFATKLAWYRFCPSE